MRSRLHTTRHSQLPAPQQTRHRRRAGGHRMPGWIRRRMGRLLRADFGSIRLHAEPTLGSPAADAIAQGEDVVFRGRVPAFKAPADAELLAHELAHVVHQRAGRTSGAGPVLLDVALEREAETAAARAVNGRASQLAAPRVALAPATGPAQPGKKRKAEDDLTEEEPKPEKKQAVGPDDAVVSYWNTQGQGVFKGGNMAAFLASTPDVDAHILAEDYGDQMQDVEGWKPHRAEITPEASLSKRRARREYITVLARQGVDISNLQRGQAKSGLYRAPVTFDLAKEGKEPVSFTTFHAPYEGNSGAAADYMGDVLAQGTTDFALGDANTYGGENKSERKSTRLAESANYDLLSGDLGTSRSGAPLDKVYVRKERKHDFAATVHPLTDFVDEKAAETARFGRHSRRAKTAAAVRGFHNPSDHGGIALRMRLKPKK